MITIYRELKKYLLKYNKYSPYVIQSLLYSIELESINVVKTLFLSKIRAAIDKTMFTKCIGKLMEMSI